MSDKIKSQHIGRKALLYVRQSSTYQVNHNLESQKLQYAMRQRLHLLGWQDIEVIDEDLGCSAAGTVTRSGFERMVAEVCMGKVGAVAAREVSRFARNSREWQQLVEVCRVVDTILIDQETIYDPRQSNDRLLLGLKGSLNEYELDLLRQRSLEARRQKAQRGELLVCAAVGFLKSNGRLEKDPDRRIQEAILSVYSKFSELGTVRQTLMWFLEHDLQLPVRIGESEVAWKRPKYSTVYHMLTNPAYGGAYAYGKTEHLTEYKDGEPRQRCRHKPRKQWLVLIPNTHDGYVSWEQFEQVQLRIANNVRERQQSGAIQNGAALLGGVLRCRRCGRKLMVQYTGERGDVVRYSCKRGWLDNGQPRCIGFGGTTVDEAIGHQLLRVVQPAAVEAAIMASKEEGRKKDEVVEALKRDLEAARYAAQRAQKQFDHADPENRQVAAELEKRWNVALERVHELETRIGQCSNEQTDSPAEQEFLELASKLQNVWENPGSDIRLKKRIVQTLIEEIVADVDAARGEIQLVIHWKGGVHTELCLPRRQRGQHTCQTPKEVVDAIRSLVHICTDEVIAATLNRNNLLTAHGNRWTRELVASLRSKHKIPRDTPVDKESRDWMNLTNAAQFLGISSTALRHAAQRGEIPAEHPFREGPWLFSRATLEGEPAKQLVNRIQHHPYSHKTDFVEDQRLLFNNIARCAL
jgi:DNA invertase Pin-like site-specific DNA recombinase